MMRTLLLVGFTLVLIGTLPTPAAAAIADVECDSGRIARAVTYLSINGATGDTRADANGQIRLRGWVYLPSGTPPKGGFPVLVFNHGSNQESSPRCELADFFVKKKFILFVPIRRGHEGSTGIYFEDYTAQQVEHACRNGDVFCDEDRRWMLDRFYQMEYLRAQGDDVTAALNHIRLYPQANGSKVAVMGQSFGGMVTLLWNTRTDERTKAIVDISGGAQSWRKNNPDDYLQTVLKDAVRDAKRPIYFLQPLNDKSTLPTAELSYVAAYQQMRWQASIFTPVPDEDIGECVMESDDPDVDTCGDIAHGKFIRLPSQIKKWGPSVVEFVQRFGVK